MLFFAVGVATCCFLSCGSALPFLFFVLVWMIGLYGQIPGTELYKHSSFPPPTPPLSLYICFPVCGMWVLLWSRRDSPLVWSVFPFPGGLLLFTAPTHTNLPTHLRLSHHCSFVGVSLQYSTCTGTESSAAMAPQLWGIRVPSFLTCISFVPLALV